MIIMALKDGNYLENNDQVMILDEGVSVQYGKFKDLSKNANSRISKFLKQKQANDK